MSKHTKKEILSWFQDDSKWAAITLTLRAKRALDLPLDNRGNTAFHIASRLGHLPLVYDLLRSGASWHSIENDDGETPSRIATGSVKLVFTIASFLSSGNLDSIVNDIANSWVNKQTFRNDFIWFQRIFGNIHTKKFQFNKLIIEVYKALPRSKKRYFLTKALINCALIGDGNLLISFYSRVDFSWDEPLDDQQRCLLFYIEEAMIQKKAFGPIFAQLGKKKDILEKACRGNLVNVVKKCIQEEVNLHEFAKGLLPTVRSIYTEEVIDTLLKAGAPLPTLFGVYDILTLGILPNFQKTEIRYHCIQALKFYIKCKRKKRSSTFSHLKMSAVEHFIDMLTFMTKKSKEEFKKARENCDTHDPMKKFLSGNFLIILNYYALQIKGLGGGDYPEDGRSPGELWLGNIIANSGRSNLSLYATSYDDTKDKAMSLRKERWKNFRRRTELPRLTTPTANPEPPPAPEAVATGSVRSNALGL